MGDPLGENREKVSLPWDGDVIQTLSSHATKKSFGNRIHSRRARCSQHNLDACPLRDAIEQSV